MRITFEFLAILADWPMLLKGVAWTLGLTAVSAVVGVSVGVACAWARSQGPTWLRPPADVNSLMASLWPATAAKDEAGELHVGGLPISRLATEHGTPAYLLDEEDFRRRCRG